MKLLFSCLLVLLLSLNSFASEYQLVGSHLLEYSIFKIDVYQISYYRGIGSEKLVLDYKTKVKKKYSVEGWKVGLKHKLKDNTLEPKIQWLLDHTVDLDKGDQLTLIKAPSKLEIYKNEKLIAQTEDKSIIDLAYEPWLGEQPVDEKLKSALLGQRP